jgi:hypothetical protein
LNHESSNLWVKHFSGKPKVNSLCNYWFRPTPTLTYSCDKKSNSNATHPNPINSGFGKKQVSVGQLILPQLPAPSRCEGPNFCSNLHANLIKFVCKGGPKSQGLSSCSLAKLRLNKVAILVNEPLVAEGHDHGLTATQQSPWQSSNMAITPLATQHIGNAKSANFWARLTLLDCLGVMPDLHLWHLSWQLLAAAGSQLLAADAEALAEESPPGASFLERHPGPYP